MRGRRRVAWLLLILLSPAQELLGQAPGERRGVPPEAPAGAPPPGGSLPASPEATLSFADALFNQKEYYRAIGEYLRFLHHFPEHRAARRAEFQVGLSYMYGEKWTEARRVFDRMLARRPPPLAAGELRYRWAQSYYLQGNYPGALKALQEVAADGRAGGVALRARYAEGWALLRLGRWEAAAAAFEKVQAGGRTLRTAALLSRDAELGKRIPQVSRTLARNLAIVLPGLGHLYLGHRVEATVAFGLNAGFLGLALRSFWKRNIFLGILAAWAEVGWYVGNVYSAMNTAERMNLRARKDFLEGLKGRYQEFLEGEPPF